MVVKAVRLLQHRFPLLLLRCHRHRLLPYIFRKTCPFATSASNVPVASQDSYTFPKKILINV